MNTPIVTVVTGATSGIGLATAKLLADKKIRLVLMARNEANLLSLENELSTKTEVRSYSCDVTSEESVKKTFVQVITDFSSINWLVNCAGYTNSKSIEEYTTAHFDEEIAVNLKGTYLCIMNTYKHMKKPASIINISSLRGRTGTASSSPGYAAAKSGIINLTKTFALQLAKDGIRVNCVSPGAIDPTRLSSVWSQEKKDKFISNVPLKRLGTPEEVAKSIYFLLSEDSSYITGHTLDVNGGIWMN